MRLTLRTLLAYLDDVLEPHDALELSKKIDESRFATELIHRIRTSIRKLRLDAPRLQGKGMGLDPNTVAEYLDSTLPSDRVPEFEKVCLESDRHLAEVASCHQVLTNVLREPAHVEASLRERVYRIGAMSAAELEKHGHLAHDHDDEHYDEHHDEHSTGTLDDAPTPPPKHVPVTAGANGHANAGTGKSSDAPAIKEKVGRAKPEVPDYLRETSRRSIWPIALTLLLAFVGGLGALRFMGPLDASHPLAGYLGMKSPEVAVHSQPPKDSEPIANPTTTGTADDKKTPTKSADSDTTSFKPSIDAPSENKVVEGAPVPETPKPAVGEVPSTDPPRPNDTRENPVPSEKPVPDKPAPDKSVPEKPTPMPGVFPADNPDLKEPPKVATLPRDTPPGTAPAPRPDGLPEERLVPPPTVLEVGRLSSPDQVVAQFDEAARLWRRLPRGATLTSKDRYIVLPTYRPIISLKSGVQMVFIGETSFGLQSTAMDDATVSIAYGRAVIYTAGRPGAQLGLDLAGEKGIATFGDGDSELAVEVNRYLPPGADPKRDQAVVVLQLYVTRGRINWQSPDGGNVALNAGQVRLVATGQPPHTTRVDADPVWLDSKNTAKVDRDASLELEGFLTQDKPLSLSLSEKTDYRKTEIRSLAARCLASLHEYEAVLRELSDERQYSYWSSSVDSLHYAVARSPESAEALHRTLARLRIDDGELMYRLICGFSPQQLESGGAKQMVGLLDSKALDVRVLAFETLRRITGATHGFQPQVSPERRRLPVQQWHLKLKDNAIVYKMPPTPLPDRKLPSPPAPNESPAPNLP